MRNQNLSNQEQLVGNWVGVEPKLSLQGAVYEFDWRLPPTIFLNISEDGLASGSRRFLEMGTLSNNEQITFRSSASDFQLMFRGKVDGQKCFVHFVYIFLDANTVLLATDGAPMSQPYGEVELGNSYEHLRITEQACEHRYQSDAEPHVSQNQYVIHENDEVYGTFWERCYEAKNPLGHIRNDRIWYFPIQQMLMKPTRYMLKRV